MKKNRGFTLIELLAVIAILCFVLAVIVPNVQRIVEYTRKKSFSDSVKLIIKRMETKRSSTDESFIANVNRDNIETYLEINNDNYDSVTASMKDQQVYIEVEGKNKWRGLSALGTYHDLSIIEGSINKIYYYDDITYSYETAATELVLDDYDDGCVQLNLGFDFQFGKVTYSSIFIATNGYITFAEDNATEYDNKILMGGIDFPIIAAYWSDLAFDKDILPNSGIYYSYGIKDNKKYVLIEYRDILNWNADDQDEQSTSDFEIILYEDGIISVSYKDVTFGIYENNYGGDATIGVYVDNTNYAEYAFKEVKLHDESAITYFVAPGTVPPPDLIRVCYTFDSSTATITDYNIDSDMCSMDVQLPSTINSIAVQKIGDRAFYNYPITSVTIPNSINTIGNYAFAYGQLTNIDIPGTVMTIGNYAFTSNQLVNVTLHDGIKSIGESAFNKNQLISIDIPDSVIEMKNYAFSDNQLTSVTLPNNITALSDWIFKNNQITSVVIPNSVTKIGHFTFANNKLTGINIPNTVTYLGNFAFYDNQLTNLVIPSTVTYLGIAPFNRNLLPDNQSIIYARNTDGSIISNTIIGYGGAKRDNVIIPNTVRYLRQSAFRYNDITSIIIPDSVTYIENYAFSENLLSTVNIPNSVTYLGALSFSKNQLTSIIVPNSVLTIDNYAFQYNYITQNNAKIDNTFGNVSIGNQVFDNNGIDGLTTINPIYLR